MSIRSVHHSHVISSANCQSASVECHCVSSMSVSSVQHDNCYCLKCLLCLRSSIVSQKFDLISHFVVVVIIHPPELKKKFNWC
jgi:hypothetical protein